MAKLAEFGKNSGKNWQDSGKCHPTFNKSQQLPKFLTRKKSFEELKDFFKMPEMLENNNFRNSSDSSQIHPLLRYDPDAMNGGIEVLKLEYFEAKTTKAPVPRNQEIPKEAFGTLTGRSILVATSHAWFHQCHPDPEGVKLEIMRKKFFPRLRERFPHESCKKYEI